MFDLVDVYAEVKSCSDEAILKRFSTSKANVLKIVKQLVKEQLRAEDSVKEKLRKKQ